MNNRDLYILMDTETANTMDSPLCYNVAWAVIDSHGETYDRGNFINSDIFYDMPELMQTAYYASKIPEYEAQIAAGEVTVANWYEIRQAFRTMCQQYGVKAVIAKHSK